MLCTVAFNPILLNSVLRTQSVNTYCCNSVASPEHYCRRFSQSSRQAPPSMGHGRPCHCNEHTSRCPCFYILGKICSPVPSCKTRGHPGSGLRCPCRTCSAPDRCLHSTRTVQACAPAHRSMLQLRGRTRLKVQEVPPCTRFFGWTTKGSPFWNTRSRPRLDVLQPSQGSEDHSSGAAPSSN